MILLYISDDRRRIVKFKSLNFRFWEMLAYLANTLIFIMVGVVIMEKALNSLNEYDLFLLVVDYFGITVIRLDHLSLCKAYYKFFSVFSFLF